MQNGPNSLSAAVGHAPLAVRERRSAFSRTDPSSHFLGSEQVSWNGEGFGAKGVQLHRPESTPCHDAQQVETKRSDVSSLGPERPSGRGYASLVSDEAASKHPGPGDGIRLLDPTFARKTALCSMKRALDVVQNNAKCGRKAAQRRHLLTLQKSLAQPMRGRGAATHRLCASRRGVHL